MKLNEKIETENNIVKYSLKAAYNDELTDEESLEIETLHDYVRKIKFADIDFTANIAVTNGKPIVSEEAASDLIVEVSLGRVTPKEYVLDENLNIEFSIDASRIAESEINSVLKTRALISQAKIAVFQAKIKEAILKILDEARKEDNKFEQETEIIL